MSKIKIKGYQNGKISPFVKLYKDNPNFMRGENNPRWVKDRTKLAVLSNGEEYRNSSMNRDWSKTVKNKGGWKCKMDDKDCSGKVEAHHILSWKDYPDRKSTRLNSSHIPLSRMPFSA